MGTNPAAPVAVDTKDYFLGEFHDDALIVKVYIDRSIDAASFMCEADVASSLMRIASSYAVQLIPKSHGGGGL